MSNRISKRIVIDACVACSSGGIEATFPTSKICRDLLLAVMKICHKVVMSNEISEEWNRHRSNFTRQWCCSMYARKKVYKINTGVNTRISERIINYITDENQLAAAQKDLHLIEAAFNTDKIIVSLDNNAKSLFNSLAENITQLKEIMWINPDSNFDDILNWLSIGANKDESLLLGNIDSC